MKLKIGIIGSGDHFKKNIYPILINNSKIKIIGILSKKKNYLNLKSYDDSEFFKLDLDFVYIATPSLTHSKFIIKSLKKNINVICEKPFCKTIVQFKKIKNLAKKKNLLVFEAFMYRFHPVFNYLKKIIKLNKYGKIKNIYSSFIIPEMPKTNNRYNSKIGGGFFLDLGVYLVSLEHYLFGNNIKKHKIIAKTFRNSEKLALKGNIILNENILKSYSWGLGVDYKNYIEIIFEKAVIKINRFFSKNKKEKIIFNIYQDKNREYFFKPVDQFNLMFREVFKNYKSKKYKIKELRNIECQINNLIKFKNEF